MQHLVHRVRTTTTWWVVMIQGIIAIILGLLVLLAPFKLSTLLVRLLGAYLFISGILLFFNMIRARSYPKFKIIVACLGIIAGLLLMIFRIWSLSVLPPAVFLLGSILGIIYGVSEIVHGSRAKEWDDIGVGVLSTIVGIILLFLIVPIAGFLSVSLTTIVLSVPFIICISSIVIGILLIRRSLRLRHEHARQSPPPMISATQE
ncbi:DUF308 domain-containing protein [Dictyobacter aurantiacus]|uniref:DUF308 domain-containing protein n=1 Tax=Dictyobacter aurantiacus TaxID=1936993 RepID=A0A401ZNR5_9CHLR|nr:DUF308 domain-containing protein [Dictyobacter aurantiacus]GCE08503.1 hypothetical protein KDAU_58320 [Dictyobacter aurantiacus]